MTILRLMFFFRFGRPSIRHVVSLRLKHDIEKGGIAHHTKTFHIAVIGLYTHSPPFDSMPMSSIYSIATRPSMLPTAMPMVFGIPKNLTHRV